MKQGAIASEEADNDSVVSFLFACEKLHALTRVFARESGADSKGRWRRFVLYKTNQYPFHNNHFTRSSKKWSVQKLNTKSKIVR
jgi:hypothetical protein